MHLRANLRTSSWVIAASLLMSPGCSPSDAGARVEADEELNGALFLTGSIDSKSLKRLQSSLSPQTKRLIVNSAGGRGPEAIQLGTLVRTHDLEVVVDGVCLSACAHFVFLPARKKRLEPYSVVAFHHTATALSDVLIASGRRDLAAVYLTVARAEQDLYEEAGVSRRALVDPFLRIMPICYWEYEDRPSNSEYRAVIVNQLTFYVPSLPDLYALGTGPISGRWPASSQDVAGALSRYPRKLHATFKIKATTSGRDTREEVSPLSMCAADPGHRLPARSGQSGSR